MVIVIVIGRNERNNGKSRPDYGQRWPMDFPVLKQKSVFFCRSLGAAAYASDP